MEQAGMQKHLIEQKVMSLVSQKKGQAGPALLIFLATLFCVTVGELLIGVPVLIAGLIWSHTRKSHDTEIDGKIRELNKQYAGGKYLC